MANYGNDASVFKLLQDLHKSPDYAKMFRGRPLRFVLPMKRPSSDVPLEHNLITVKTVNQGLESFQDDAVIDQNRAGSEPSDKSNTAIGTSVKNNRDKKDDPKNILRRRAAAHRLPDGNIFVKPELLCDLGCETPRLNNVSYLGREYRYFYAISSDVDLENPGTVIVIQFFPPIFGWKNYSSVG